MTAQEGVGIKPNVIADGRLAEAGMKAIARAEGMMPILGQIRSAYAGKGLLDGLHIASGLVVSPETAVFLNLLRDLGARITVLGSGMTSTNDEVAAALAVGYGYPVYARKNETMENYEAHLDYGISLRPDIFLDDGAIFAERWSKKWRGTDVFDGCMGVTELTTSGITHARVLFDGAPYPYTIVNVNDTMVKSMVDNSHGTAQSMVTGIMQATGCMLRGKVVTVIGYGRVGMGTAFYLQKLGAKVIAVDIDEYKELSALLYGVQVLPLHEALALSDVVVTATGEVGVLGEKEFGFIKDGCYLANGGHDYIEIDVEALERMAQDQLVVTKHLTMYRLPSGKNVFLLCRGGCVNLSVDSGCPPEVMDLSFASNFMGVKYLLQNKDKLSRTIYNIPDEDDRHVARLKIGLWGGNK